MTALSGVVMKLIECKVQARQSKEFQWGRMEKYMHIQIQEKPVLLVDFELHKKYVIKCDMCNVISTLHV